MKTFLSNIWNVWLPEFFGNLMFLYMKIQKVFDAHPFDWIAHLVLGFAAFYVNYGLMILFKISPLIVSMVAGLNVIVVVELVQFDIFGMDRERFGDTIMDLLFGVVGICLAIVVLEL